MNYKKTLIVCTEKRFSLNHEGKIVNDDGTRDVKFWSRYLSVFKNVIVVARVNKKKQSFSLNYVENKNIIVYPLTNYQGIIGGLKSLPKLKRQIRKLVDSNIDCAFILRTPGTISNMIANQLIDKKRLYSVEIVGDPYEVHKHKGGFGSTLLANIEKKNLHRILKHASFAAYVTKYALQRNYPFEGPWQTYYSSISLHPSFFIHSRKYDEPKLKIIGIGSLETKYKGLDYVLDALYSLKSNGVQFRYTWVGGGKLLTKYENKIKYLNLSDSVTLLGEIPNYRIPEYLSNNNVFLLSSLTEGLPRVLIEAMASRLICIGTDVGGVSELLTDDCLIAPGNSDDIFKKMLEVNNNFDKFLNKIELQYQRAIEFSQKILTERRNEFYQRVATN